MVEPFRKLNTQVTDELMKHRRYSGKSNTEVAEQVPQGLRMKLSVRHPDSVRQIVEQCWAERTARPTFSELVASVKAAKISVDTDYLVLG